MGFYTIDLYSSIMYRHIHRIPAYFTPKISYVYAYFSKNNNKASPKHWYSTSERSDLAFQIANCLCREFYACF